MKTNPPSGQTSPLLKTAAAVLLLLLCGAVFVGGVAGEHTSADHSTWINWGDEEAEWTSLPDTAGSYYLTHDVTLSDTHSVTGTLNLCLNGYVIKQTTSGKRVINVPSDATLNLYDCDTTTSHTFRKGTNGRWVLDGLGGEEHTVTGGCITGGEITSDDGHGGGVYVAGTFNMSGGNIVGNTAKLGGGVYVIGGTFTMNGGTISGNSANLGGGCGGGVYVDGGAAFTMNGGTISYNRASYGEMQSPSSGSNTMSKGGGVYVAKDGKFTMNGGTISYNRASCGQMESSSYGGGVYVAKDGTFTMNGGTISDNKAYDDQASSSDGGGVYVNGMFVMNNGTISNNKVTADKSSTGGGVFVNGSAAFTMNGGTISNNLVSGSTNSGGGVYVSTPAAFTMEGGSIACNTAAEGGGVYVSNSAAFTMEGGSIACNTATEGSGVYVIGGTFSVSGNPVISGNTKGSDANNVYLNDDGRLTLAGPFTGDIRISRVGGTSIGPGNPFGVAAEGVTVTAADAAHFRNDDCSLCGRVDGSTLKWTKLITESMVSLTPESQIYSGDEKKPTVTVIDGEKTLVENTDYTVTYSDNISAGTAAKVTVTGKGTYGGTVEKTFTITPRSLSSDGTTNIMLIANSLIYTTYELTVEIKEVKHTIAETSATLTLSPTDYSITSGDKGTEPGDYTLTITGTGNYKDTATASWKIVTIETTITLDPQGGSGGTESVKATYGQPMPTPITPPTKTGYSFLGYFDAETGGKMYYDATGESVRKEDRSVQKWDKLGYIATLYAHWTANLYYVEFNANGGSGTMDNQSFTYDEAENLTANAFTRAGYAFDGWDTNSAGATVVYADKASVKNLTSERGGTVNLYAVWSALPTHTITTGAVTNGTLTVDKTAAAAGETITVTAAPDAGYQVSSLTYTPEGGTAQTISDGTFTMPAANVTVNAVFAAQKFQVTFDGNKPADVSGNVSGLPAALTEITSGEKITKPAANPTLPGYTFGSWYKEAGCTNAWNFDSDTVTADTTLFAKWTAVTPATYTVTFNIQGHGTAPAAQTVNHGGKVTKPTDPTAEGCTFGGWYKEAGCTNEWDFETDTVTKNTTLYAKWTLNTYTVTITVDTEDNYGTVSPTSVANVPEGTVITASGSTVTINETTVTATPKADDAQYTYAFSRWDNGTATVTKDTTVTAHFTKTPKTYTITYNLDGGTAGGSNPVSYTIETETFTLVNPTKTGHTFAGWTGTGLDAPEMTVPITKGSTGDRTYTATWTANQYTVTLDKNGGEGGTASVTATYGAAMPPLNALPTKTGYSFAGYFDAETDGNKYYNTNGTSAKNWDKTGDTTLYAHWSNIPVYKITYKAGDGSGADVEDTGHASGSSVTLMAADTFTAPTGKVFDKWSDGTTAYDAGAAFTMPGNDVTMTAQWKDAPAYTISITQPTGGSISTTPSGSAYAGQEVSLTFTADAGKALDAWSVKETDGEADVTVTGNKFTMPAKAVTVTATVKDAPAYTVTPGSVSHGSLSVSPTSAAQGETITVTATPDAGYQVSSLTYTQDGDSAVPISDGTFTMPAANVTVNAEFAAQKFQVTFDKNGGDTEADPKVIEETYDTKYTLPTTNPTKSGSNFAGWFTDATGGTQVTTDTDVKITADATLYAHWSNIPVYKITYKAGDGSGDDIEDTGHASGSSVTLKAADTFTAPTGKVFDKWSDGTTAYDAGAAFTMPGNDVTMTAQWTEAPVTTYTVTFDGNKPAGASGNVSNLPAALTGITSGSTITKPAADPTLTGYTFGGWYKEADCTNAWIFASDTVTGNTTLYAKWTAVTPVTYTVTPGSVFHGSLSVSPTSAARGETITVTATPDTGYQVSSLTYTQDGGSAVPISDGTFTMPAADVTVNAVFTEIPPVTVTVTFDLRGHGANFTETVNPGDKVTRPSPDPSAIGCIFGGWHTDSGCTPGNEWDFNTPVTGDMTLYAKWTVVSYTAKVEDYTYGGIVPTPKVTPADPADVSFYYIREGQAYSWDTLTPTTLDAGSYYVRAVDNTGTIERIKDSSFTVNKAEQVKPDISVEAVADGIKTTINNYMSGYTYQYRLGEDTWILVPTGSSSFTIPGLDAETPYTVTVKINAKGNYKESISDSKTVTTLGTFSVSYNANGGVGTIEPQSATMGESITVASSDGISRSGYTFTVWTTNPDGTGDSFRAGVDPISYGAVLYAQWTPKSYTLTLDGNGGKITGENRVNVQSTYGDSINLSEYPAVHSGSQNHVGWALTPGSKSALYAPNQKVQNLGDITLYAVWVNKAHDLTVHVQNEGGSPVEGAKVTLKLGSASFQGPKESSSDGDVTFSAVPEGIYTLVVKNGEKTVTQSLTVDDKLPTPVLVIIPAGNVSSIVQIEDGTPAVAVNGLAETAADSAKDGEHVDVTVTVETKTEGTPASGNPDDQETQIEIKQINKEIEKNAPAGSKTEYLGINIEKTVNDTPEKLTSTANVLEFLIPYDFNGKFSVTLYRCHNGEVTPLTEIKQKYGPDAKREDGKYYLDTANGMIYLYSSQFSTYGVNYVSSDSPTPSRSSSSTPVSSTVWLTAEPTPTVTPTPAPAVTQTPEVPQVKPVASKTPAGKSPVPVMGVLAGLGAAGVLFGLRMRR